MLNALAGGIDPSKGMSYDEAVNWFEAIWDAYNDDPFFRNYKKKNGGSGQMRTSRPSSSC